MVNRLEALADAIAHYSGWNDPSSVAYENRNPGALKAYMTKQPRDDKGLRVFRTALDGYQALLYDLRVKCSGLSNTRLKKNSTLRDLILAYQKPLAAAKHVATYLKHALHDESLSDQTVLSYFLEKE